MTNGDLIRRLENGHLCASLRLLLGLEIAELEGEPQGGVPAGPSRGPERRHCGRSRAQEAWAREGRGRRDTAQTHTERGVVVWPELGGGCVWDAGFEEQFRSLGSPSPSEHPLLSPRPPLKRERESKRKKENKISPVVETRGENRGKHP